MAAHRETTRARYRPRAARRRKTRPCRICHARAARCVPSIAKYPLCAMRRTICAARHAPHAVRHALCRRTPHAMQPCAMRRASHAARHTPCSRTPEFWPRNRALARSEAIFVPFYRAERGGHGKTPGRRFSIGIHAIGFVPERRLASKNERIFRTRVGPALSAEGPAPRGAQPSGAAPIKAAPTNGSRDQ